MQKSEAELKALQEKDIELLKQFSVMIKERGGFDSVRIFVTRHEEDNVGTSAASWGAGNYYAAFGQITEWLKQQSDTKPTGGEE